MSSRSRATSRSRVEIDGRDYYREPARRHEHDDVEIRVRERSRSRDRLPHFLREDRRPEAGPLVLRQREVEERVLRRRSPSPVRLRETRILRARSVSPLPPRRIEENVRYRNVERVREPSRGPDIERLRARIIDHSSSSSSSPSPPPAIDRVRARFVERTRSPSPVRERIRIVEKKEEKVRQRSPSPERIKGPIIEREVITHYRDIDHGVVQVRPPSPPPPIRRREKDRDTEIDIDIRRSHSHSRARGRSRSRSHERVSHPHHSHSWDKELVVHSESKHLHVDVEARRSHSRHRRAYSEAPPHRDDRDYYEGREITSRIDSRGKMGEARNGITKDWTIIDVPPGTERVRMDGAGGGAAEVTWQKYSGVRRSRFIPDRDEVSSSTSLSEHTHSDSRRGSRLSVSIIDKEKDIDRRPAPQRSEMWTEITKDLVIREAIEEMGYEYEETEWFFYVMTYLRYEDVLHLVQLSDGIRRARKERKERIAEIQWERGYQDDWDREYRIHAHSHHHHDGRRRRYDDDDYVEREISYESRGSRHYHS